MAEAPACTTHHHACDCREFAHAQELADLRAENEWLRRLLVWCRARLTRGVYQTALDVYLEKGQTYPDGAVLSQSALASPDKPAEKGAE